ncbi:hypothetical protein [Nocardia salmonicida]|uniref:hypothetical protein n=1 Tax=Nocardia salmonicida TaxID=53431 RepID=UPI0033F9A561
MAQIDAQATDSDSDSDEGNTPALLRTGIAVVASAPVVGGIIGFTLLGKRRNR